MFIQSGHFETEAGGEVLFISEHHVDERREFAIDFTRARLAANRLPETVAIIQIERNDRAVSLGRLHCFFGDCRCCFRERAKDAAGVKPARAFLAENLFPVDVTGTKL